VFDHGDLALQFAPLPKCDGKLFLKLADVGVKLVDAAEVWGAMTVAETNEQAKERRNKELPASSSRVPL
jgi:hypothetical protein